MHRSKEAIENGLELYRSLLGNDPAVEEEFARTRAWFAGAPPDLDDAARILATELADRRHLEWFLLEHPCEALGGVPAAILRDRWLASAESPEDELAAAFTGSLAGAFEVTEVDRAQGLWLRDLFGLGEYPIIEPEAATLMEMGDLVVGRIFPVGDGLFRLSPAAACFRDAKLRQAVSDDASRMRRSRRGVLRVEQIELERLFFGAMVGEDGAGPGHLARVRELLAGAGVPGPRIEGLCARVRKAGQRGDPGTLAEVLSEAAFETEVDLAALHRALASYWAETGARVGVESAEEAESGASEADVRAALAAFDAGREEGRDLEELFRDLEQDLGCAPGDEELVESGIGIDGVPDLGDAEIPDFPWAVGAMVEEFFWERERDPGRSLPGGYAVLRLLSEYGRRLGVFENLSLADLVDFAGRWVLDHDRLNDPGEARALVTTLADFCLWCENEHGVQLVEGFALIHAELEEGLARLVEARGSLAEDLPEDAAAVPYEVADVGAESVTVRAADGATHEGAIDPRLARHLRVGDWLRGCRGPRAIHVLRAYPGVVRILELD